MKDVIFKPEQIWSFSHSSSSVPPDITLSVSQGCNKYLQNFLKWLWLRNPCIYLCSWGSRSQCPSRTVAENNRLVLLYININKKHLFISSTWCRTSGQVGSFLNHLGHDVTWSTTSSLTLWPPSPLSFIHETFIRSCLRRWCLVPCDSFGHVSSCLSWKLCGYFWLLHYYIN